LQTGLRIVTRQQLLVSTLQPRATLPPVRFTRTVSRRRASSSQLRLPSPPHYGPGRLEPILSLFPRLAVRRLRRRWDSLRARVQTHLEAPPRLQIPRHASLRANGAPRPGIASAHASCETAIQTSPSAGALARKPARSAFAGRFS
jgi:hypothetical protein